MIKNATEEKVRKLVEKNHKKMRFSLKHSNRSLLRSMCIEDTEIEWGVRSQRVSGLVDKHVNRLIPKELD